LNGTICSFLRIRGGKKGKKKKTKEEERKRKRAGLNLGSKEKKEGGERARFRYSLFVPRSGGKRREERGKRKRSPR